MLINYYKHFIMFIMIHSLFLCSSRSEHTLYSAAFFRTVISTHVNTIWSWSRLEQWWWWVCNLWMRPPGVRKIRFFFFFKRKETRAAGQPYKSASHWNYFEILRLNQIKKLFPIRMVSIIWWLLSSFYCWELLRAEMRKTFMSCVLEFNVVTRVRCLCR